MSTPVPLSAAPPASLPDLTPHGVVPLAQRMDPAQQRQTLEPERDAGPEEVQRYADDAAAADTTPLLAVLLARSEQALALARLKHAATTAGARVAPPPAGHLQDTQQQARAPLPASAVRAQPAAAAVSAAAVATAAATATIAATPTPEAPAVASVVGLADVAAATTEPRSRRDAEAANPAGSAREATPQQGGLARGPGDAAEVPRGTRPPPSAAPAWEAVRSAEASAASARSQVVGNSGLTVNFNSWGEGHAVTANLAGQGVLLSPSSERVGAALADASLDESLRWRVARADEGADERRHDPRRASPEGEPE